MAVEKFCAKMPTRLVAFASPALRPVKISSGSVISDPAADTAFTKPAKTPPIRMISAVVISNVDEYRRNYFAR